MGKNNRESPIDCKYPDCEMCDRDECDIEENDIQAMLKRRRWNAKPERYREKQNAYRREKKQNLPRCDDCKHCVLVRKEKLDGHRRLCIDQMRLIEAKVSYCPQWCPLRGNDIFHRDYIKRLERKREVAKNA